MDMRGSRPARGSLPAPGREALLASPCAPAACQPSAGGDGEAFPASALSPISGVTEVPDTRINPGFLLPPSLWYRADVGTRMRAAWWPGGGRPRAWRDQVALSAFLSFPNRTCDRRMAGPLPSGPGLRGVGDPAPPGLGTALLSFLSRDSEVMPVLPEMLFSPGYPPCAQGLGPQVSPPAFPCSPVAR